MDLIQYLVETAGADQASRNDAESLRYVCKSKEAKWLGPKDGINYVSVDGETKPVNQIHATIAIPKNEAIMVRYANGKLIAYW